MSDNERAGTQAKFSVSKSLALALLLLRPSASEERGWENKMMNVQVLDHHGSDSSAILAPGPILVVETQLPLRCPLAQPLTPSSFLFWPLLFDLWDIFVFCFHLSMAASLPRLGTSLSPRARAYSLLSGLFFAQPCSHPLKPRPWVLMMATQVPAE